MLVPGRLLPSCLGPRETVVMLSWFQQRLPVFFADSVPREGSSYAVLVVSEG